MAERRKLDRRRVYPYAVGLRKRVEASMSRKSHHIEQKTQNSIKASMAINIKNAVSKENKSMSPETIDSLAWWFGGATVFFTILTGIAGWARGISRRNHRK
ncbi:MAG: hypothetical protein DME84_05400 [Verrucomicrobia bacterium]|nr:MAG: hypothetical protein DME84_05400 [Verrucomicrobiota bacterium]